MSDPNMPPRAFNLSIPRSESPALEIPLQPGKCLFVFGANGTGKSTLMYYFYSLGLPIIGKPIFAHRQNWLPGTELNISSEARRSHINNIQNSDVRLESRWRDHNAGQRPGIALYDLVAAENQRARDIMAAVDANNFDLVKRIKSEESPFSKVNNLFRLTNIPIEIKIGSGEQPRAIRKNGEEYNEYSVSEMSDGERSALFLAADVLTANPATLFLIDEPERHLHRSIISPLLTHLFRMRPDCAFVISSHEVMLSIDNPTALTVLIRSCNYNLDTLKSQQNLAYPFPGTWEADLLNSGEEIDDDIKKDILGARRTILFVEGTDRSLDKQLYSVLFPGISVIAKESCREVERSVSGIRANQNLHWLKAFGIVDNDRRPAKDISKLQNSGTYTLSVFSVESLYYHPEIQRRVTERHTNIVGGDVTDLLAQARSAAIKAIAKNIDHLSCRVAENTVRQEIFRNLPNQNTIKAREAIDIKVDVAQAVDEESGRLQTAVSTQNITEIVINYPIRETEARNAIASSLKFSDREQYENAVLKMVMEDIDVRAFLKSLLGSLSGEIDLAMT